MKKWVALTILAIFALQGCGIVGGGGKNPVTDFASFTTSGMPLEDSGNVVQPASEESISSPVISHEQGDMFQASTPVAVALNPLTGLPVANPDNLKLPPALVSITNWPVAARPQAGLSFAPFVFELYIGEGMSRFLALFYGDFPSEASSSNGKPSENSLVTSDDAQIGPIRSGRLPYEHLRKSYNGFLVMASAYAGVAQNLGEYTNYFGSDADNINGAMISVNSLEGIARASKIRVEPADISVMHFNETPSEGGKAASRFWFMYNAYDQIIWRYDATSGAYHRYQDQADGKTFVQAVDRLTGEPLTFENVVVLFANHRACTEYAFDVDLMYIDRGRALIFRDGQMHEIFWTTRNEEYEKTTGKVRPIRFIDAQGQPFPFKPGQTWVHLVPLATPYWETADTEILFDLLNKPQPGSGNWAMRYYASSMIQDQSVCEAIRKK